MTTPNLETVIGHRPADQAPPQWELANVAVRQREWVSRCTKRDNGVPKPVRVTGV